MAAKASAQHAYRLPVGKHMFADSGPLDPAKQFLSDSLELPLSFVLALSAYAYQRSVSLVLAKYKGQPPHARAKAPQVIELAASGRTRTQIAAALDISERSVYRILAETRPKTA